MADTYYVLLDDKLNVIDISDSLNIADKKWMSELISRTSNSLRSISKITVYRPDYESSEFITKALSFFNLYGVNKIPSQKTIEDAIIMGDVESHKDKQKLMNNLKQVINSAIKRNKRKISQINRFVKLLKEVIGEGHDIRLGYKITVNTSLDFGGYYEITADPIIMIEDNPMSLFNNANTEWEYALKPIRQRQNYIPITSNTIIKQNGRYKHHTMLRLYDDTVQSINIVRDKEAKRIESINISLNNVIPSEERTIRLEIDKSGNISVKNINYPLDYIGFLRNLISKGNKIVNDIYNLINDDKTLISKTFEKLTDVALKKIKTDIYVHHTVSDKTDVDKAKEKMNEIKALIEDELKTFEELYKIPVKLSRNVSKSKLITAFMNAIENFDMSKVFDAIC